MQRFLENFTILKGKEFVPLLPIIQKFIVNIGDEIRYKGKEFGVVSNEFGGGSFFINNSVHFFLTDLTMTPENDNFFEPFSNSISYLSPYGSKRIFEVNGILCANWNNISYSVSLLEQIKETEDDNYQPQTYVMIEGDSVEDIRIRNGCTDVNLLPLRKLFPGYLFYPVFRKGRIFGNDYYVIRGREVLFRRMPSGLMKINPKKIIEHNIVRRKRYHPLSLRKSIEIQLRLENLSSKQPMRNLLRLYEKKKIEDNIEDLFRYSRFTGFTLFEIGIKDIVKQYLI